MLLKIYSLYIRVLLSMFPILAGGVGLLPPEHVHLKSILTESQRRESHATTISIPLQGTSSKLLQEESSAVKAAEGSAASGESILREVSSSEFLKAVKPLDALPVAYLDFLPVFGSSAQQEEVLNISRDRLITPMEKCWALTLH